MIENTVKYGNMAQAVCKKCGGVCCTCTGCNPKEYVNGLCPSCQKELKDVSNTPDRELSELQEPQGANKRDWV